MAKEEKKPGEITTVPASKFHSFIGDWSPQKLSVKLYFARCLSKLIAYLATWLRLNKSTSE
jgi:hypothetical protein